MAGYLIIANNKELHRLPADNIVYVAGGGDYSDIMMIDGKTRTVTFQLGQMDEMLNSQLGKKNGSHLVRIGKSLILNTNFITYVNPNRKQVILSDCRNFEFTLSASKEALTALKEYFENPGDN